GRGAGLVALLAERDIALASRARFEERGRDVETGPSDALDRLERFEDAAAARYSAAELRARGLDTVAMRAAERTRDQLLRRLERGGRARDARDANAGDDALLVALLAGFGDRVAQRRR